MNNPDATLSVQEIPQSVRTIALRVHNLPVEQQEAVVKWIDALERNLPDATDAGAPDTGAEETEIDPVDTDDQDDADERPALPMHEFVNHADDAVTDIAALGGSLANMDEEMMEFSSVQRIGTLIMRRAKSLGEELEAMDKARSKEGAQS